MFIHEIIHCLQFEIGEIGFVKSTGRTLAQDILTRRPHTKRSMHIVVNIM